MGPKGKPGCFLACVLLTTHILLVHGYRETFVIKSECVFNGGSNDWVETPCLYCYQGGVGVIPCVWTQDGDEWRVGQHYVTLANQGDVASSVPAGNYEVLTRRGAYTASTDIQRWSWTFDGQYRPSIMMPHSIQTGSASTKLFNALKPGDELTVCSSSDEVCTPCYGDFQQWDAILGVCTCTAEFQQLDPITRSCRCRGGYM
jgi:hypothetical protein